MWLRAAVAMSCVVMEAVTFAEPCRSGAFVMLNRALCGRLGDVLLMITSSSFQEMRCGVDTQNSVLQSAATIQKRRCPASSWRHEQAVVLMECLSLS